MCRDVPGPILFEALILWNLVLRMEVLLMHAFTQVFLTSPIAGQSIKLVY